MNPLAQHGKRRTLQIFASILLINLTTIYIYQSSVPTFDTVKLVSQIIRLILTVGMLYLIYIGKKWAKIVAIILFSISVISSLVMIFTANFPISKEIPFYVMIFVYSDAIYHFGFSQSFKAFEAYQNKVQEKF